MGDYEDWSSSITFAEQACSIKRSLKIHVKFVEHENKEEEVEILVKFPLF